MKSEKHNLISKLERFLPPETKTMRFESWLSISLLVLLSFFYYYILGRGIFSFQESNMLFIFSGDYLSKFTDKPGGLLLYAGNFLTQFYINPLAGSLMISALFVMLFLVFREIAGKLNAGSMTLTIFALLPSAMIMLMQTRYDFHLHDILGFLLALSWFIIHVKFENRIFRIVFLLMFPVLYYVAGSYSFIYTAIWTSYCVFHEKGPKRYFYPGALALVLLTTYLVFRNLLFFQSPGRLLTFPLFLNETKRLTTFLALLSAFIVLMPLIVRLTNRMEKAKIYERFIPLTGIAAIITFSVIILINTYDPVVANIMKFERMVHNQDWDGIIREQEKIQSSNIIEQYFYNLALSEKGELCSRMFYGRQSYGSMALTLSRDDDQAHRAMYFYYTIGLNGEAHHIAYELMVQHGYRPETIKMLIRTEILNGNYRIAERYINVLKKTLFYRGWAEKYGRLLYKPEAVKMDRDLGRKAVLMPGKDFFVVTDDFRNIDMLLDANPANTVAFEYKMARFLLEKDIMEAGKEVKKLKGLGYSRIPRHIEEAIISLVNVMKEFPDMGGLTISKDADQRFPEYFTDIKSFGGDRKLMEKGIKKNDRNSFWYYMQFGRVKSDFMRKGQADQSIY
jgi:hypothetical protein